MSLLSVAALAVTLVVALSATGWSHRHEAD
jgi:hypothetical protein